MNFILIKFTNEPCFKRVSIPPIWVKKEPYSAFDFKNSFIMNKLIIDRRSEWTNRGRKIGLYLNQEKIGTIENGETKEFDLKPGSYNLKAKIDWCGSQEHKLTFNENEIKIVELSGFPKNKWTIPLLILAQFTLLGISYFIYFNQYLMIAFSFSLLIYIFYPITFGRNHYLKLYQR